jgi:7-hydroxymethyl chlorophyll a reductase
MTGLMLLVGTLWLQVRNKRGREMLDMIQGGLETSPVMSAGNRKQFVLQTAIADDEAKLGKAPNPMPHWLGTVLAWILEKVPSFSTAAVATYCSALVTHF